MINKDHFDKIVFGADVHTCWENVVRYFDVEMRIIPMEPGKYTINAHDVALRIDENTIAVGAVVGTTFTGQWMMFRASMTN